MNPTELHRQGVVELAGRLARRELSAVELARHFLQRM